MIHKKPSQEKVLMCLGSAPYARLGREINLRVWNMQKCTRRAWKEDFLPVAEGADILLLQEAKLSPSTEKEFTKTNLFWALAISFFTVRGTYPVGVATASAAAPVDISASSIKSEPFLKIPKMTMSSFYDLEGGGKLLVINTHVINFKGIKHFKENIKQAHKTLSAFDGPVIIAGDFNTWSKTRRTALEALGKELGLTEVLFTPDDRTSFFGRKVDYILTRGLKVKDARVIKTKGSDHNALSARLAVI